MMLSVSGTSALSLRDQFLALTCCYFKGEKSRNAGAKVAPPDFDTHNATNDTQVGVSYRRLPGFSSGFYNQAGFVRWMQPRYLLALDDAVAKPLIARLASMFTFSKGKADEIIEHLPRIAFEIIEKRNFLAEALRMLDEENGKHASEEKGLQADEVSPHRDLSPWWNCI